MDVIDLEQIGPAGVHPAMTKHRSPRWVTFSLRALGLFAGFLTIAAAIVAYLPEGVAIHSSGVFDHWESAGDRSLIPMLAGFLLGAVVVAIRPGLRSVLCWALAAVAGWALAIRLADWDFRERVAAWPAQALQGLTYVMIAIGIAAVALAIGDAVLRAVAHRRGRARSVPRAVAL